MKSGRQRQQGQILVIFAGGIIALLLIASLVIDTGFVFMMRRQEQNAADPGALAAARYIRDPAIGGVPNLTGMQREACFYARQNGFFPDATDNDSCDAAHDPAGTTLTVHYPPVGGPFSGFDGHVQVIISREHRAFLAGIVGITRLPVTTDAVAAFNAGDSNPSSLIALDNTNDCQAGKTHGTGAIIIHPVVAGTLGGYIHVNSTCTNGTFSTSCDNSGQGALDIAGSGSVTAPHTYVSGTCKANGGLNPPGSLTEGAVQIGDPLAELPPPSFGVPNPGAECGVGSGVFTTPTGSGAGGCRFSNTSVTLAPGVYYGGWDIRNNVDIIMQPGIYVIAGGGVKNTGGSITSVQSTGGAPAPVLIFNTDNPVTRSGQADLDFTATGTLKLRAIDAGPYKGILLWNDGNGSHPGSLVTLGGQTTLDIAGTVYSPKGNVKMEGGSGAGSSAAVQIIAWQFDVGGNSTLDMPYDPNQLYKFPQKGLVY
jgi:hypothetical protein